MVDTVQNLAGTTASVVVPETSSAPQVSSAGTTGSTSGVEVGTTAPAAPVVETETKNVSVDVNSAMGDVLTAMRDMPPPIDLEAVQRIKAEIAQNSYPVDYEKISDALIDSLNELS